MTTYVIDVYASYNGRIEIEADSEEQAREMFFDGVPSSIWTEDGELDYAEAEVDVIRVEED